MKRLFSTMLIMFLCAGVILAQERVQKVVAIKNGNLSGILKTVRELAPANNLSISTDNQDHIILSGSKEAVSSFEEIIKQLDVLPPAKNDVETTVYMIVASVQANSSPMPPELDPVLKQLKAVFNYKGFRLLDNFVLRSRDGERGETNGFLPAQEGLPPGSKITYGFRFNRVNVDGAANAKLVRFDGLRLVVRVPVGGGGSQEANILTDVDVPEGKKVVVGKTSAIEGADSALILVISAKVVD